ncbi:MAG: CAP domain-containing protein [Sphaerotilus natans subsp. sulfidivorans]|uniref:CAP domain-containing protein n=1 Tax=Sphaerotilus sulfidivorans TaxID=639200 RepID=UPI002354D1D3|nr:CAP domain-containing protein [Sphaerotilus sulfidivorans]MCK6401379.1 CAP domain-containing protein [Sphaerotilus sulfidivorans]
MIRTCNKHLSLPAITAALLAALLTGCGGGSDDGGSAASTTASASAGSTAQAASAIVASERCGIDGYQSAMLAEINRRRASAQSCGSRGTFPAAGALSWNDQLFAAAAGHAKDMVARSFFSHTGSSGSSVADRVSAAGYAWSTVAENIAAGQPGITRVVDAWMNSDGHCANLMNATVRDVAVACVVNTANQSNYWVMDLAKAR